MVTFLGRRRAAVASTSAALLVGTLGACASSDMPASQAPVDASPESASQSASGTSDASADADSSSDPERAETPGAASAPPAPAPEPDFDGSPTLGRRTAAAGSGEYDLVLTDVRTGQQDGYDRVVMEFRGTGVPGYQVRYETDPRLEGSGERVRLRGPATLVITADRTTYPGEGSDYYDGPSRLDGPGSGVTDVLVAGTFEGYTDIYAGVADQPRPYRVFTLAAPPRLVVDIATG